MPTTYYYTVNDEIIGEHTVGQSRLDYLTDALGSVVATIDQTLTTKSTARYKPYGADLATTGAQVMYGWVGGPGYRRTGRPHAEEYVQKRTMSVLDGQWLICDPLWPDQPGYAYGRSNPSTWTDPTGLCNVTGCDTASRECVIKICFSCKGDPTCQQRCDNLASRYYIDCITDPTKHKKLPLPLPWPLSDRYPGHWTPIPGVGVVPPPPCPKRPCNLSQDEFNGCNSLANPSFGIKPHYNVYVCLNCVKSKQPPGCPPDTDSIQACWTNYASWLLYTIGNG